MSKAGVTLTELVVALGLAAVLAGAGALGMTALVAHVRLAGATETLAAALRAARVEALARHETLEVAFDAAPAGWSLRAPDGPPLRTGVFPAGVTLASAPPRARIRFGPLGTADNASVALAAAGSRRTVVVNQRGRVRAR